MDSFCTCLAPCRGYIPLVTLTLLVLQLKTEAKKREQELAGLEGQDTSLSARIAESKMGKENSVCTYQHPSFPAVWLNTSQTLDQGASMCSQYRMRTCYTRRRDMYGTASWASCWTSRADVAWLVM